MHIHLLPTLQTYGIVHTSSSSSFDIFRPSFLRTPNHTSSSAHMHISCSSRTSQRIIYRTSSVVISFSLSLLRSLGYLFLLYDSFFFSYKKISYARRFVRETQDLNGRKRERVRFFEQFSKFCKFSYFSCQSNMIRIIRVEKLKITW